MSKVPDPFAIELTLRVREMPTPPDITSAPVDVFIESTVDVKVEVVRVKDANCVGETLVADII